jgi:hypothetical protein
MQRIRLMTYKGLIVAPDVAAALRALEAKASESGWRVRYIKPDDVPYSEMSLLPAGREVWFIFEKEGSVPLHALHAAWGAAVPLGFTPKLRDPLLEPGYQVYRYLGPWQGLYGKLLAEGRGHLAWPSVCCAAQVDVGKWLGDKEETRFVQAQLHRMGRNSGPIDGVVGQRTAAAIESLALPRASLTLVAEHLLKAEPSQRQEQVSRGHLHLPGRQVVVQGHGGVKAWPMDNGAGFEISGPGRIVVDVR